MAQSSSINWTTHLQKKLDTLEKKFEGEVGVLIKEPTTNLQVGLNEEKSWYLASAIKVPVAIETLNQIEKGILNYDDTLVFRVEDKRDGAGPVSFLKPGTKVKIRYLLEQMLIESDNAATDMLIKKVGIDNIQKTLHSVVPTGFGTITTLLEVRQKAYGELHKAGHSLKASDFQKLKKARSNKKKLELFSSLTKTKSKDYSHKTVKDAYESYYTKGYNSSTLTAFTLILEKMIQNQLISEFVSQELFEIMSRCRTGKDRIKAGLPKKGYIWAHKTGTQLGRKCDFGVLKTPHNKTFTIAICVEKFKSSKKASEAMANIAKALVNSLK